MRDPYAGKKKLLIWADVQTGFHHDAINHAAAVIERLGRESGAYVSIIRTDSQLVTKLPVVGRGTRYKGRPINARNLDQYDAIFFLGAGEGTLDTQQKADLLSWVRDDGKGLVVGHAGGVAFFDWPEWGDLIGGFMDTEYPVQPMPIVVEDPKFPGVQDFGTSFTFSDQFPVMKSPYAKGKVHTIMRLDWSKLTPEQKARRPDGDIPVVYAMPYGKGRVFNSGFGHPDATWDDPRVQKMYLGAIRWAMGLSPAAIPLDR
jgi:type 1 glutamine amidotransferase